MVLVIIHMVILKRERPFIISKQTKPSSYQSIREYIHSLFFEIGDGQTLSSILHDVLFPWIPKSDIQYICILPQHSMNVTTQISKNMIRLNQIMQVVMMRCSDGIVNCEQWKMAK